MTKDDDRTATDDGIFHQKADKPRPSVKQIEAYYERARELAGQQRFTDAMNQVLPILDTYPKHKGALELGSLLLSMTSSSRSPEQLPRSILGDPVLDPLFHQCHRCLSAWPFNPLYAEAGQLTVTNPVGGRCRLCGLVWCRTCAGGGVFLGCPTCGEALEVLRERTGRRRGLGRPKHPELALVLAVVYKQPPEPRNRSSYVTAVIDALCPEAFHDAPRVQFEVEPFERDAVLTRTFARAMLEGIPLDPDRTFIEDFTDADGGRGVVVTFYRAR
jgi:hypothetical protein